MGTRSGDLDPAIIDFVGKKEGLSLDARHEIFAVALEGKEITFDESEDESPDLQM